MGARTCLFVVLLISLAIVPKVSNADTVSEECVALKDIAVHKDQNAYAKNIDDVCSGRYGRSLAETIRRARRHIEEKADRKKRQALVLDIDETSLSNMPQILADQAYQYSTGKPSPDCQCGLPRGPCDYQVWESLGIDDPIKPVKDLARFARSLGIEVFFITGRVDDSSNTPTGHVDGQLLAATRWNLSRHFAWRCLVLQPKKGNALSSYDCAGLPADGVPGTKTSEFKSFVRDQIQNRMNYEIVANIGDHCGDLIADGETYDKPRTKCPARESDGNFLLMDNFY